jgi:hypothetical protein
VGRPGAQSGGHSRLDALNRPYANADIPSDFPDATIPAGERMFNLPLDSPICPLATQFCSLRLCPGEAGHYALADQSAFQFREDTDHLEHGPTRRRRSI